MQFIVRSVPLPHLMAVLPTLHFVVLQISSFVSLARALFGDFDIDAIFNNSRGYLNVVLFISYLFVAVFIMLSMFFAILGESQVACISSSERIT